MDQDDFVIFLRLMSKKGFLEILLYISNHPGARYSEIHKFANDEKLVASQASITIILNGLTNLGLVDRAVIDAKPPKTTYTINKTGRTVLTKLNNLKNSL